jgi:protein-S-isoprenylcysteine O-methyltransferase Ste14
MISYSLTEKWRIYISKIIALFFFVFILFTTSKWEGISFITSIIFLAGCILVGIASLGRLWCSVYIAGYKNETLVTVGPYSISRHPLYFFNLIGGIGVGLATETLLIPFSILILFLIYYPMVIRNEERRLLNLHDDEYMSYCKKPLILYRIYHFFRSLRHTQLIPKY